MDAVNQVEEACFINLGPKGIRRRRAVGLVGFGVGIGLTAALVLLHAPWAARLALFFPFAIGAVGLLQARGKT